jgi:hypothetical protein
MTLQAWYTCIWGVSPIFLCRSSQVLSDWMGSVAAVFSGLSRDVRSVRALAGPFMDIQRLVPNPVLHCLGCVLRVVVLLEGEPLEQVFINDLCTLLRSSFPGSWFRPNSSISVSSDQRILFLIPFPQVCVSFQIMSNQLNLPQDSKQVVEKSHGWSMETGCTWAQFRVS